MARRPISDTTYASLVSVARVNIPADTPSQAQLFAASQLVEQAKAQGKKKARNTLTPGAWKRAADEAEELAKKDWRGARGVHLLVLWSQLHHDLYGVAPAEMDDARQRLDAARTADRCIAGQFKGDAPATVEFMKWAWAREVAREKWRRDNPEASGGGRLTWRLQFSANVVSDYRVAMTRER